MKKPNFKLNINFQQLLLEKGELIGLCVAGGIALLLLVVVLVPNLFSGSASGHVAELDKATAELKSKHQTATPSSADDTPPDLKSATADFEVRPVDPEEYRAAAQFFRAPKADDKRQMPRILKADEFAVTVVRGPYPALELTYDQTGNIETITVIQGSGAPGTGPAGVQADLYKRAQQSSNHQGLNVNTPAPGTRPGHNLGRYTRFKKIEKPRNKLMTVSVAEAQGKPPALAVLPARLGIIAATFPYKQQVEEFQRALRLANHGAVLGESLRDEKGNLISSFQFLGVEVERMTLNDDGSDGKWEPLDVDREYLKFLLATYGQREQDDPKYAKVLEVSGKLQRRVPKQLIKDAKSPDVIGELKNIKTTLEKLKETNTKDVIPPPSYLRQGFDPDEAGTPQREGGRPSTDGDKPDNRYGSVANMEWQKKLDKTPVDHCLIRFIDVQLEPGRAYKYRFKVRMLNPNYSPKPEERKDTYVHFATEKELKSDWAYVPQVVSVPPDQHLYALPVFSDGNAMHRLMRDAEPWRWTFRPPLGYPPNVETTQAAVQIHRWVESYYPPVNTGSPQPVGDWLVAARIIVERGEFVHDPGYLVPVPIKPRDLFEYELDTNPKALGYDKILMPMEFGDESILVDFEGGERTYRKSEADGEKVKILPVRDQSAMELLIMQPDGKMVAHNSVTDWTDTDPEKGGAPAIERKARAEAFTKRVKDLRDGTKPKEDDPLKRTDKTP